MTRTAEICGEWHLAASASETSELHGDGDGGGDPDPDPDGVARWLSGFDDALLAGATDTAGLVLTVLAGGTFTERVTGRPPVVQPWFDVDGVLADEVQPFDGSFVDTGETAWLKPRGVRSVQEFGRPAEGRWAPAVLRYDDGDTRIADSLRLVGTDLVRTVNVVTDDLYLDRVVLVYRRAAGA